MEETPEPPIMTYFRLQGQFCNSGKNFIWIRVSGENGLSLHAPAGATRRRSIVPGRAGTFDLTCELPGHREWGTDQLME